MIWGIGIDIVDINRVQTLVQRYGDRFLSKVFTRREIAFCQQRPNPWENFAARIAVKEAASKAVGTGWRQGVHWKNFEVTHAPSGKPSLRIHGRAKEIMDAAGVVNVVVSMSHDGGVATAQVIMETESGLQEKHPDHRCSEWSE